MTHFDGTECGRCPWTVDAHMEHFPAPIVEKLFPRPACIGRPAGPAFRAAGEAQRFMHAGVGGSLQSIGPAKMLPAMPVTQSQIIQLEIVSRMPGNQMIVDG
jgi:hypothetical protein